MAEQIPYGTGRRKTATARVRLTRGKGVITINNRTLDEYFGRETARMLVRQPFVTLDMTDRFDVSVRELMTWNRLRQSSSLRAGQRLVVYTDSSRQTGG